MTALYKPVLIESAEQAEALPIGTVALDVAHETDPDLTPYVKITSKLWVSVWEVSDDHELGGYGVCPNSHIVGDSALVPIEAEEETREHPTRVEERPESAYLQPVQQVRYKTRWESA